MYMDVCDLAVYIIPWEWNHFHEIFDICSSYLEQKLWLKVKKKKDKGFAPEQKIACTFSICIDEIIP